MAQKTVSAVRRTVTNLLRRRGMRVERVVVFGSAARGALRADSDIDLAIVSSSFRRRSLRRRLALTSGLHSELVQVFNRPFDILYFSVEEWRRGDGIMLAG
jgi:uncharacterized protein